MYKRFKALALSHRHHPNAHILHYECAPKVTNAPTSRLMKQSDTRLSLSPRYCILKHWRARALAILKISAGDNAGVSHLAAHLSLGRRRRIHWREDKQPVAAATAAAITREKETRENRSGEFKERETRVGYSVFYILADGAWDSIFIRI